MPSRTMLELGASSPGGMKVMRSGGERLEELRMMGRLPSLDSSRNHVGQRAGLAANLDREMGRLTALIHTVPTSGFGQTFDWSKNQLSRNESWRDYLRDELKVDARIETLEAGSFLPGHGIETLRAIFGEMETWTGSPSLNHGDMRMKNVLTDENGAVVAVFDWEFCTSTIAPYWICRSRCTTSRLTPKESSWPATAFRTVRSARWRRG